MLRENFERHWKANGAVANRALELIGKKLGLLIDRKEIAHKKDDLDDLSRVELARVYTREAQLLLEDHSKRGEEDEDRS
jgi:hypothetical protein